MSLCLIKRCARANELTGTGNEAELAEYPFTEHQTASLGMSHERTAEVIASSPPRRAWSPPGSHTWVTGPRINEVAAWSSSGVPNGSRSPETNRHGVLIAGKCSVRARSGRPGGCKG